MNEYDSYLIINVLKKELNLDLTNDLNSADILILNTCLVREKASEKVFSLLGRWKKIKDLNKNLIICVGGCLASFNSNELLRRSPYVDLIFGPQSLHKLAFMIKEYLIKKTRMINISFDTKFEKFKYILNNNINKKYSSYVTIIEGCNKYCTYCIVPYTRGFENSRNFNDILSEVYNLSINGIREITFLGQNVNSYFYNLGNNEIDLSLLMAYVSEINEIKRIKFLSANPLDFDDSMFFCYNNINKLSNHLHLPVQSGSNKVLKLMKRGYTVEFYIDLITKLKVIRPNITFSTDIIVGFPGETDNDFIATLNLIKSLCFDNSFVYIYSPRIGTLSYKMTDSISLKEKKSRLYLINEILFKNSLVITESMINSLQRVLVYKKIENNLYFGKSDNNRDIVFNSKISYIGDIIDVKIIDFNKSFLIGTLI